MIVFSGTRRGLAGRSQRSEDERQVGLVNYDEIDRTNSNVAGEVITLSRHLRKHGAERTERDQGRRGGWRTKGARDRRKDSEACSDDSGSTFDRLLVVSESLYKLLYT